MNLKNYFQNYKKKINITFAQIQLTFVKKFNSKFDIFLKLMLH